LVSGSYIGWMTQMMQEMFVGGRLKWTPVSPQLTPDEGMEAVLMYSEYHGVPITERIAMVINSLTQSDPFYISVLFGSDFPEKDFSTIGGVVRTLIYEMRDRRGELFRVWSEYIDNTVKEVNDIHGKKVLLYLSKERHRECTRDEIREHVGWPPERDMELDNKLLTLEHGGLVTRGTSDFHYQGIPDDILDLIFRERYQYEIETVKPDAASELAGKIKALGREKKSLQRGGRCIAMERDKEQVERRMIEQVLDLKDKQILEIGCGDGRVTAWLADKAKYYAAIDPDAQNIAAAGSKIIDADFRVGTGEQLEFEKKLFDVVLFTLSLHHQDSRKALQEAHRVLRKGGRVLIIEPAVDGEVQQFFNIFHNETQSLKNALNAIENSDFTADRQEMFYTDWIFENKEELYNYNFDPAPMPSDEQIIKKMNELLGDKIHSQPIRLKDKLLMFSLRKNE
ncbi:class I SAM-dependent methyltransferase, partial [Desulfobacterales bacterium HSG2]|nr:class I SAM-dependent methyltransferase [Desulfobacterales bacterium HSG2]